MDISLTLPDGKKLPVEKGISAYEAISKISNSLARECAGALLDGVPVDLSTKITKDSKFSGLKFSSKEGLEIFRHSSAHVLCQAVLRLFPNALPTIGPVVEEGFYYDFANCAPFTPEDLKKIEAEAHKIVAENLPFERKELPKKDALALYKKNKFKQELIDELPGTAATIYYNGAFFDLCRGPHIPSTGMIKGFSLSKVSSSYWRADSSKESLQRIYGISFPSKKELDAYLHMLAEAEKRDHRKLGTQLGLFMFHEWSPGSAFFLPNGTIIYNELLAYLRAEYIKRGYQEVVTPQLFNKALWEQSGHWSHYQENMFLLEVDKEEFSFKPMNCPSHLLIYKNSSHSYRELPIRIADFCPLHRNELKGVLGGMTRVRKFEQDDAHIFCTHEQIEGEVAALLDFTKFVLRDTFHFEFTAKLSTRPEKFLGEKAVWDKAEASLEDSLKKNKMQYTINAGDGAFYGPKIDFCVKDAIGREWQLSTIQLDFNLPARFDATYEGADGKQHTCVMIHRAIIGSLERFIGVLTEHYGGAFPLWLSPVQITVIPVADAYNEFAQELAEKLRNEAGVRISTNLKPDTLGSKIRDAQMQKIPYMLVVGQKEKDSGNLAVRKRDGSILENVPVGKFIAQLKEEIEKRA
ncbi:putative threonine--tRNA ligase 1 [Candidatus Anstonella stagnisolia]|nr:putative threonine--tRNA ligase 1 [Candidatus Anstonella stagnisolia]